MGEGASSRQCAIPPVWPRVYDPNAVFALLLERREEDAQVETECATYVAGLAAAWLGAELAAELEAVWSAGMWLPQEALGAEQLHAGAIGVKVPPHRATATRSRQRRPTPNPAMDQAAQSLRSLAWVFSLSSRVRMECFDYSRKTRWCRNAIVSLLLCLGG